MVWGTLPDERSLAVPPRRAHALPGLQDEKRRSVSEAVDHRCFALDALPEPVVPHEKFVLERVVAGGVAPVVAYGFG